MESISIIKVATNLKKEAKKFKEKKFIFAQIQLAFIQCSVRLLFFSRLKNRLL